MNCVTRSIPHSGTYLFSSPFAFLPIVSVIGLHLILRCTCRFSLGKFSLLAKIVCSENRAQALSALADDDFVHTLKDRLISFHL